MATQRSIAVRSPRQKSCSSKANHARIIGNSRHALEHQIFQPDMPHESPLIIQPKPHAEKIAALKRQLEQPGLPVPMKNYIRQQIEKLSR